MFSKVGRNKRLIRDGLEKNRESEESANKSTEEDYMQQRTRETSTATTETTPSEWALKEGTIPDHNDYPVLHPFGIPIDNKQTTR
jgi:hypothetical protein